MIKVVKHGKKVFTTTCKTCGCQFSYEINDMIGYAVRCPECGNYCIHTYYPELFNISSVLNENIDE